MRRVQYQQGHLAKEPRKAGPAVWIFRWREGKAQRKSIIGTVEEFTSKAAARRACERIRATLNKETRSPRTMAELIAHYQAKELCETSGKAFSTRTAYNCYLRNWIVPKWGSASLSDVRTIAVEDWLHALVLSAGTRAKIRNLMSTVFNHACRYEWMDKNPIRFVRQGGMRERVPDVLDASELRLLLGQLADPYRTMVFVAAVTGLRVSEMLALKWDDVHFDSGEIHLNRAIVCQHVGPMKTSASRKPIPMHDGLAAVLLDWRGVAPYNQATDYLFASPEKNGAQPYWPSNLEKHVRPAAKRAGITKHVTWHVFRHSYGTLLKADGADVKTTQELMRHANSKTTMDVYVQAVTPAKREAHGKVVESLVVPRCSHAAATANVNY